MRQPYGRDIASTVVYAHPVWFARHGYNVVIQDVRGRGDSGGDFYPFRNEGRDGADTIAWLRARPESNGRIGMYGFSYQGMTQLLAAAEQPEGLVCIAPHMTAADLYHGWFYHQGALRLASTLGWGIQMLREDAGAADCAKPATGLKHAWANIRNQTAHVPYAAHPAITDSALPTYVRDWFAHREPGEYWTALDISTRFDRITGPRAAHLRLVRHLSVRAPSTAISRCATAPAPTLRARINTFSPARGFTFPGAIASATRISAKPQISTPMRSCCAGSITGSKIPANSPTSRAFATSCSEQIDWRSADEWPDRMRTHSICTATATPIRAKAMAAFRAIAPASRRAARYFCLRS